MSIYTNIYCIINLQLFLPNHGKQSISSSKNSDSSIMKERHACQGKYILSEVGTRYFLGVESKPERWPLRSLYTYIFAFLQIF